MAAEPGPLTGAQTQTLDAYWRAANYLSVGQIYLMANPLLAEPLRAEHIKPRLLGHWGTSPGLKVPPGDGRDRPGARAQPQGRLAAPGDGRHPGPAPRLDPGARRGPARGRWLGLAGLAGCPG
jgi:xylulose-5-phosphate/fructose-6-phosphate phosphoketolase